MPTTNKYNEHSTPHINQTTSIHRYKQFTISKTTQKPNEHPAPSGISDGTLNRLCVFWKYCLLWVELELMWWGLQMVEVEVSTKTEQLGLLETNQNHNVTNSTKSIELVVKIVRILQYFVHYKSQTQQHNTTHSPSFPPFLLLVATSASLLTFKCGLHHRNCCSGPGLSWVNSGTSNARETSMMVPGNRWNSEIF